MLPKEESPILSGSIQCSEAAIMSVQTVQVLPTHIHPCPPPLNHRPHTPPTPPPPSPQVNFSVSSLSASNLTVDNLSVKNVEYSKVDRCAAAWLSCEYAVCVSVSALDFAPFFRVAFGWCSGLSHAGGRGVRNSVRAGVFEVRV